METPPSAAAIDSRNLEISSFDLSRRSPPGAPWCDRARLLFEQMLSYANHLGLYAEQTGPQGEALGNFPQAFTRMRLLGSGPTQSPPLYLKETFTFAR